MIQAIFILFKFMIFLSPITGINPEAVKWGDDHYDRLLCPGLQPGPPSQTPGGLGQRYWSVSEVTWPPKLELRRWRSSGPSSLMRSHSVWWLLMDRCLFSANASATIILTYTTQIFWRHHWMTWKRLLHNWPFVREIHWPPFTKVTSREFNVFVDLI